MRNAIIMLIAVVIFLGFFTVFSPVEICIATGSILYVGEGQTYSTIQAAINAANGSGGDTIYVYGGTYNENVVVNKPLTITSIYGSGTTKINGVDSNKNTVKVEADNVRISGFTVENTNGLDYACIFLSYTSNCVISNNVISKGENGVYVVGSNGNTISGNTMEDNDANGVSLSLSVDNNVYDNAIKNNVRDGVYLSISSTSNEIYQNTISGNSRYGLYLISSSDNNIIHHNQFINNKDGNAKDICSNNWDDGSEGNYWDDYTGEDNDGDGIGDTPYSIPGGSNQDEYPLGYFGGENQMPIANAGGPYSGQVNSEITFDGSGSSDLDGNIVGYRWDWTNDDTYDTIWFTISSATHSYSAAGSYTVKLQVKDDDGATNTDTAQVTITEENQKPTAIIVNPDSPTSTVAYGEPVDFHGYGLPSEGMITEWSWRSSIDSILSSQSTFTKSNLSVGTHTIYFKVKDSSGWSDEVSTSLVIELGSPPSNEPPVADAGGPYTGYVNVSISFDASASYDPDGDEIISYVWDFGDGTNGTGITIEHTYNSTGNYTVTLTVTDSQGKTATNSTYANVSLQPTDQNGNGGENGGTPGFEIIFIIIAVAFILLWKKEKRK